MANRSLPSPDVLRKLLRYEPETGELYWLPRAVEFFTENKFPERSCAIWNTRYAGRRALAGPNGRSHHVVSILNKVHLVHRVAWAIYYGAVPEGEIDHINGDGYDNRIANLRDVSHSTNLRNQKRRVSNTSGTTGVSLAWDGKWRARIGNRHLGRFPDYASAVAVRKEAERILGFHENHGR